MWKMATIFGVPPALIATYYHAFYISEHHQRPEYKEYDHIRIRSKVCVYLVLIFCLLTLRFNWYLDSMIKSLTSRKD